MWCVPWYTTRWLLEGSEDGNTYFVIENKTDAKTDLPHDLVVNETGFKARYMALGRESVAIRALIKGQSLYIRVDTINETGITQGDVLKVVQGE